MSEVGTLFRPQCLWAMLFATPHVSTSGRVSRQVSVLPAVGALISWGVMDFLVRLLGGRASIIHVLLYANGIGVLVCLLLLPFYRAELDLATVPWSTVAVAGAAHFFAYFFLFTGLARGPVAIVSPIASSYAGWAVVVAVLFMGASLTAGQLILVILLAAGIVLVSVEHGRRSSGSGGYAPVVYGLFATLGLGTTLLLVDSMADTLPTFWIVFLMRVVVTLILVPIAISLNRRPRTRLPVRVVAFIGPLDVAAFLFYAAGVAAFGVVPTIPVSAAFPVVTVLLARAFVGERVSLTQVGGIALIIVCTAALAMHG